MTYKVAFHEKALKEWKKLDSSAREQFNRKLRKVAENPHIPGARLSGELKGCYKIKLRKAGYGLVYQVVDKQVRVYVISIGRRDDYAAYRNATQRVQ